MTETRQVRRQRMRQHTGRLPEVGFSPMPNDRIDAAMAKIFTERLESLLEAKIEEPVAMHFAYQAALAVLPVMPIGRRHRAPRPSKSDCPRYRKQAIAA